MKEHKSIIFFDDECIMCNGFVAWLIKKDHKNKFYFSALKSQFALRNSNLNHVRDNQLDTLVYKNSTDHVSLFSTAVLNILKDLGGLYKFSVVFFIIPKFLRDHIYKFIAKNRHRFFDQQKSCALLNEAETSKFLV